LLEPPYEEPYQPLEESMKGEKKFKDAGSKSKVRKCRKCGKPLRIENLSGYCKEHVYLRYRVDTAKAP
jgi:hypothetical protein